MRHPQHFRDYNEAVCNTPQHTHESANIVFHALWIGNVSEKHLVSIQSCRLFHPESTIILWTDDADKMSQSTLGVEIARYASIRTYDVDLEMVSPLQRKHFFATQGSGGLSVTGFSDTARLAMLLKYGGVWFDLDIVFLRPLSPLLQDSVFMYEWEDMNYPNNALFFSPIPMHPALIRFVQYAVDHCSTGLLPKFFGLTYDVDIDILVHPYQWFDPAWKPGVHGFASPHDLFKASKKRFTLDSFCPGAFCFHWHNAWSLPIADNSPFRDLQKDIQTRLRAMPL